MSNYSRFIVCWSGIDRLVENSWTRTKEIFERYHSETHDQGITYRLPDWEDTACEAVVVGSTNYFEPAVFVNVLRSFAWEKPDEVELFWKSENDTCYRHATFANPPDPT